MSDTPHTPLPRPGLACAAFVDLLPLLGEGTLAGEEAEALRVHLGTCAYCQTQCATYDRIANALSRYGEPPEVRAFSTEELLQITQDAPPAPATPRAAFPTAPRRRFGRLVSGFSALAAVLVIALLTASLFASHHPGGSTKGARHTSTSNQAAIPPSAYVAVGGPDSSQNALVALNPADGSVRWQHDTGSTNLSSIFLQNGVLYAGASDGKVYAFSAKDGSVLWSFQGLLHTNVYAVVNGVVYAGSDDESRNHPPGYQFSYYSYALDASTGHLLWTFTKGNIIGPVVNTIAYVQGNPAIADRTLYALNVSDGSVRWTSHGNLLILETVADGVAYTTTTQMVDGSNMDPYATIHALDASSGNELWAFPKEGGALIGSLNPGNGAIYFASNEGRGSESPDVVYALNTSNSSVLWQLPLAPGFACGMVLNNGVLYVGVGYQTMLALNATTGSKLWQAPLGATPNAAGDGLLVVSYTTQTSGTTTTLNVAGLNPSDGSLRWHYPMDGRQIAIPSTPVHGVLYVTQFDPASLRGNTSATDGHLLAIDDSNGTLIWSYDIGKAASPVPLVIG